MRSLKQTETLIKPETKKGHKKLLTKSVLLTSKTTRNTSKSIAFTRIADRTKKFYNEATKPTNKSLAIRIFQDIFVSSSHTYWKKNNILMWLDNLTLKYRDNSVTSRPNGKHPQCC